MSDNNNNNNPCSNEITQPKEDVHQVVPKGDERKQGRKKCFKERLIFKLEQRNFELEKQLKRVKIQKNKLQKELKEKVESYDEMVTKYCELCFKFDEMVQMFLQLKEDDETLEKFLPN